jgi:hypothetical protein
MRRKLGILALLAAVCTVVATTSVQAVDPCSFCLQRCQRQYDRCIFSGQTGCEIVFADCEANCYANHCP